GELVGAQRQRTRRTVDPRCRIGDLRRRRSGGGRRGSAGGGRWRGQFAALQPVETAIQVQVLVAVALLQLLVLVLQLFQRRAQLLHLAAQQRQLVEQVLGLLGVV